MKLNVMSHQLEGVRAEVWGLWGGVVPQLQTLSLQGLSQDLVDLQSFF